MNKTIVMIHGAFAGGWCFENFADTFEERGWSCHRPNLRFHGSGPVAQPDPGLVHTGIEDYTSDMVAAIDALGEKPVLLGHSMGGIIAQKLAAKGLARALILLAPCPPWGISPCTDADRAVARGLMSVGPFWNEALHPVFEVAANDSLANVPPQEQCAIFDRFGPESGRAIFETFFWMFDDTRATAVDHTAVTCPVLVISGSNDKVISAQTGRRISDVYGARASFEAAPGHGHFLLVELGWEQLAGRCADWASQAVA